MKITSSEFIKSETDITKIDTEGLPEIALVGKSNVGKSSFINRFANRKALARTSSSPGRTQTANLYKINSEFYFIDVPGYGYAKASKAAKASFQRIVSDYIKKRQSDFSIYFLIDSRHEPSTGDLEMWEFVKSSGAQPVVILTKVDKISKSAQGASIKRVLRALGREDGEGCFPFSVFDEALVENVRGFTAQLIQNQ